MHLAQSGTSLSSCTSPKAEQTRRDAPCPKRYKLDVMHLVQRWIRPAPKALQLCTAETRSQRTHTWCGNIRWTSSSAARRSKVWTRQEYVGANVTWLCLGRPEDSVNVVLKARKSVHARGCPGVEGPFPWGPHGFVFAWAATFQISELGSVDHLPRKKRKSGMHQAAHPTSVCAKLGRELAHPPGRCAPTRDTRIGA
eukprot:366320-Chlamydomonas_euryale.AAC.2